MVSIRIKFLHKSLTRKEVVKSCILCVMEWQKLDQVKKLKKDSSKEA